MDRFLVRTVRKVNRSCEQKSEGKRLKQATIDGLKGVVVIEDILKYRSLLQQPDQTRECILDCLRNLDKKIPSREVLKLTKIGRTVMKLRKHKDKDVAELSEKVTNKWLRHYTAKLTQPSLDVKCDHETEQIRSSGRKHLRKALQSSSEVEDVDGIARSIEREVFVRHKNLVNLRYRRTLRKLIFVLKDQESIRKDVLLHNMTITDLVMKFKC